VRESSTCGNTIVDLENPQIRCRDNDDFDEYWRYHLAREHQRLYPRTAQGNYALGA
jgi:hypothetical protein